MIDEAGARAQLMQIQNSFKIVTAAEIQHIFIITGLPIEEVIECYKYELEYHEIKINFRNNI